MLAQAVRAAPVQVAVASYRATIPSLPSSEWLLALSSDEITWAVVPGLLGDKEAQHVLDLVMDGVITDDDVDRAAYRAIAEASGRDWWEAVRLVGAADTSDGLLIGDMTLRGVDPDRIPFARWCSAAYALLVKGRDEKERMKLDAKLSAPPPGFEEDVTMDAEDMQRLARSMPGMRVG